MPDNRKWRPYVSKALHFLAKSWIFPLLVREQEKVASLNGLVRHSKVAINGHGGEKKRL